MQGTPSLDVKYLHNSVHLAFLVICFLCFLAQKVILNFLFSSIFYFYLSTTYGCVLLVLVFGGERPYIRVW